ncbi:MAG: PilN domain-containing protein, partial [bacterium]|nr:PilN domain-containing protein [bacterium]
MNRYINLLSSSDQKDIRLEKVNAALLNSYFWLGLSLLALIALLCGGRFFLKFEISQMQDKIALQQQAVSTEQNQKLKKQLNDFNARLRNLVNLDEHQALWSEAVINFARLVPKDVAIDSFIADRQTGRIKIAGQAKTRESVLQLRNNLLGSEYFRDVNFPLSNLTRATNVNFRYNFFINE